GFVQYADSGRLAGSALLEIYDGDNRLVIDYGASGAPVFDCEGRIAAVISIVMTQTLSTPFGVMRLSTAWGSPNVVSVPIQQLTEFLKQTSANGDVCFTPESGHVRCKCLCPLWARSGH